MSTQVLDAGSYKVHVGDILDELDQFISKKYPDHTPIILGDSNTLTHALQLIDFVGVPSLKEAEVLEVEPGEESKEIEVANGLWQAMLDLGVNRKTLLVNLGGGMITDLGGFLAGTFKRGIPFIQVPTSLLAMVDASVGGKVGINLGKSKNQVGLFLEPAAVFAHLPFLNSLPLRERIAGMAEMIKHGLIADNDHFKQVTSLSEDLDENVWLEAIHRSISIKEAIVRTDFTEQGDRKKLNFGHTVGHAIESWSQQRTPLLHGEAIFVGMWCETWLSHRFGKLKQADRNQILNILSAYLPEIAWFQQDFEELFYWMKSDKKNTSTLLNFTFLSAIGDSDINVELTQNEVVESLEAFINR